MQHLTPGDYMTGSAKAAIDTALRDAKGQRVGGAPVATPGTRASPAAAPPGRPGIFA